MTDLQAAIGIHQLERLDGELEGRAAIWHRYDGELGGLALGLPAPVEDGVVHARHLYSVLVATEAIGKTRDQVLDELHELGIGGGVHFTPVHLHPYYRETFGYEEGDLPAAERIGARTLSLPFAAALEEEDVADVVAALAQSVGAAASAVAG
jgi:dTDP-4-amino-4,6-dideoxygalactose transaminase